jgi:hypothetical protein
VSDDAGSWFDGVSRARAEERSLFGNRGDAGEFTSPACGGPA